MAASRFEGAQLDDLRQIRALGPELLDGVVNRLRDLQPPLVSPNKLVKFVSEILGPNKGAAAEAIVRTALLLYGWIHQGDDIESLLSEIRQALKSDEDQLSGSSERWQPVEKAFGELLVLQSFRLAASALELSYEYAQIWRGARILTDVRPLFADDAITISAAVISQTFRLRFFDANGVHELNIAMDNADIRHLAEQCQRALQKARTASAWLAVPTLIVGESDDA